MTDENNLIVDSSVEETGQINRKLIFTIAADRVENELDSQFRDLKKSVALKGFRKGKAPIQLLQRHYGDQVEMEVKSSLLGEALKELIEKYNIQMVSEPQIEKADITDDKTLVAEIIFEVKPEIEVKDYKELDLTREPLNVLEAAVDERMKNIHQQHATLEPIEEERAAMLGDTAEIDFEGKVDDVPFEGGKGEGQMLELGSSSYIPGFEEGVVGMNVGEIKDVKVRFPDEYQAKNLAGKDAVFTITVKALKVKKLPELNDDFAKDLGGDFKSLDDVKDRIRKDIEKSEKARLHRQDRKNVLDKLFENNEVEAPPSLIEQQLHRIMENVGFQLQMSGLQKDQVDQMLTGSEEKYRPEAIREVKAAFLFESVAKQEEISVSDEDMEKKFESIADETNRNVEAVKAMYEKDNILAGLKESVLEDKVLDFLIDNANVKWEEPVGATKEDTPDDSKDEKEDK